MEIRSLLLIGLAGFGLMMSRAPVVGAQPFAPFSDFEILTLAELEDLQVKLTFVGEQEEVIPSLAIASHTRSLDLSRFLPFRRPDVHYGNDEIAIMTCTASPAELKAMIENISTLPSVTSGDIADDNFLSFAMLYATATEDKAFEAILNEADTRALFEQLGLAFDENVECLEVLTHQWQDMDLGASPFNTDAD
jgi:hypothetical protein